MSNTSIQLHVLNALIGCLCIAVLGLTAHAVALKDEFDSILPSAVKATGMTFLFWPGCGGMVDMLLFILLWKLTPWEQGLVCLSFHSDSWKFTDDQDQEEIGISQWPPVCRKLHLRSSTHSTHLHFR
jgi:hypothetical protein